MTDIEQKALALAIETRVDDRYRLCPDPTLTFGLWEALCRAIERHEAFRQEVSDAVEAYLAHMSPWPDNSLRRFILAKPDPLEDVLSEAGYAVFPDDIERVRAALEARGLAIVKKEAVNGIL